MTGSKQDRAIETIQRQADSLLGYEIFRDWIEKTGSIGETETGGVTRLAFGYEDLTIRERVISIMRSDLGLKVQIDAWGNIIAHRPGKPSKKGNLMAGSHLDTVRNGGKFDGAAGVFCALEVIRLFNTLDIWTDHPLEVIVFAAEEANQSGISTIGSRGVSGRLKKESLASFRDDQGVPLFEAIEKAGGKPAEMDRTIYQSGDVKAYLEIHNEQMTRLEKAGIDLGIVTGVTGIRRRRFTVTGTTGHGGTIPMQERQDALVAAASIISAVKSIATESGGDTVATVGHIKVEPNSVNVVPGRVELEMEIRSYIPEEIDRIDQKVFDAAKACEEQFGVQIERGDTTYDNTPREFSPLVRNALQKSCESLGYSYLDLVSMAGHDAYHMSYVTESGMIFVPSKNGKSHCPEEFTDYHHLANATKVLATALLHIDKED